MKIAIVGAGVSGNVAGHLLARAHEVTVFEAGDHIGGHTNTVEVDDPVGRLAVDTGFIVFNDATYPQFIALLRRLRVASKPAPMSFGVRCETTGLEFSNRALFAQRRNVLRPTYLRMLADVARFNRESKRLLARSGDETTLGAFVREGGYSRMFVEKFLEPMGAAIWSSDPAQMHEFPARFFAQFFANHRFLDVLDQPEWRVVSGGSRSYVEPLVRPFRDRIRLSTKVDRVRRAPDAVYVTPRGGAEERFDEVVLAVHSDQALGMLADPSDAEREVLGKLRYQENVAVLHTDGRLMPRRRAAWACWNAHVMPGSAGRVTVTYWMNLLQGLVAGREYFVTLNRDDMDPSRVLRRITYHHPVYTTDTVAAQRSHGRISGVNRTHYAGAYWGYGFHEDGVKSALAVCRRLGQEL